MVVQGGVDYPAVERQDLDGSVEGQIMVDFAGFGSDFRGLLFQLEVFFLA